MQNPDVARFDDNLNHLASMEERGLAALHGRPSRAIPGFDFLASLHPRERSLSERREPVVTVHCKVTPPRASWLAQLLLGEPKMTRPSVWSLAPLAALTACTGYELSARPVPPINPFAEPPPGLAQVCVVRPKWPDGTTMPVRDNGKVVGALRARTFFCYFAGEGAHHMAIEKGAVLGPAGADLAVATGQRYFVSYDVEALSDSVRTVSQDEYKDLIQDCRYAVVADVPPGESSPGERPSSAGQPASN